MDWVAAGAIVNAAVGVVILAYTIETRKMRLTAEKNFKESLGIKVVPVEWRGDDEIEIINLGPGPAKDIVVRALHGPQVHRCLEGSEFGLVAGQSRLVNLRQMSEFVDVGEWPRWSSPDYIYVEIRAKTVLGAPVTMGKEMVRKSERKAVEYKFGD